MKKIMYLLMIIPIAFASCEVEKLDKSEELTGIAAKTARTLIWPEGECTVSPTTDNKTDLIAGQNMVVGTVTVDVVGDNYIITYDVDAGYCLSETHLSVVSDRNYFPMTNSGNPKNGHFEYSGYHSCESSVSYTVPTSRGTYIAAHAVVNCESEDVDSIEESLPVSVDLCVTAQPEANLSYFWSINITDTSLQGDYGAWCVDEDFFLAVTEDNCATTISATVLSSYDDLSGTPFENPQNFDEVNWILNQNFVGMTSGDGTPYTYGDVQWAIWGLMEDDGCDACGGLGVYSVDRGMEILTAALDNGSGFEPTCGQFMGIILLPKVGDIDKQPIIIPRLIECNDCDETAWASGCDFPGNNWAMYFEFAE